MTPTITISGAELRRKLDEGSALVIDVREPGEFAGGHMPGALNVPLGRLAGHGSGDIGSLVHPWFHGISAFVGAGLMVSGLTGFCGMALLLAKAPWSQRGDRQAVSA